MSSERKIFVPIFVLLICILSVTFMYTKNYIGTNKNESNDVMEKDNNKRDDNKFNNNSSNSSSNGSYDGSSTRNGENSNGTGSGQGTTGKGSGIGNGEADSNGSGYVSGNGTGTGSITNGNGVNAARSGNDYEDSNGTGRGTGNGTGSNGGSSDKYDDYKNEVSVNNNSDLEYVEDPDHDYSYSDVDVDSPAEENIAISNYSQGLLNLENNERNIIPITLNLLNAPYNNNEYCEAQLGKKFKVVLSKKPKNSTCSDYPTELTFEEDGTLNIEKHRYTKTASLDFSDTKFNMIGDYYFDVKDEKTDEVVYQVIVSFRNVTDSEGYPLAQTYSVIQLKSMKTGTKVSNMNINLQNENTFITLEQEYEKSGINENFYLDLIIDSYDNEYYSVLDGNLYEKEVNNSNDGSTAKIGNHIIIREGDSILSQTYRLINGGKIIVGQDKGKNQIPVGTRYKVVQTTNKNYREKYTITNNGEFKIAAATSRNNVVTVTNLSKGNPYTGLYYAIIPFVVLIVLSIVGIITVKKLKLKK